MKDDAIQNAYEEWCAPRMNSVDSDHPRDAFAAGYLAAIALMRGQSEQCDATVEDAGYPSNPHQCSRKAVAGSPYCAQHRKMYAPRPTEGPSR